MEMKLNELLTYLHEPLLKIEEDIEITSIEMDSRAVKEGSLFVCIDGYTVDGHDYADQAVEKGAVVILAEKPLQVNVPVIIVNDTKRAMARLADAFYRQPTQELHLIGVTGTNGKTTTTHIIEKIMAEAHKKTGLIGTMYIKIGDEQEAVQNTTPESLTLQKTFRKMRDKGVTNAMIEVSSHALDLGRVHGCDFDVAVFTNLTQDHLDYHHTMEAYKQAKGLLFAQLGNNFNVNKPKFAVLNRDETVCDEYIKMTAAKVLTYGIDHKADVMANNITMTSNGTTFDLIAFGEKRTVSVNMAGKFSIYNILAAACASLASNIDLDTIVRAIEKLEGVRGRFELVDGGQDFTVIVDYAHTPDSLENVLLTIKQFAKGDIFCVVGCGGDRDKTKRPLMAQIAAEHSNEPIFTSDNPRSEDPGMILKDMEAGVLNKHYHSILSREEAISFAIKNAKKNDVVLIAGKGHETYQQIGKEVFDFDDREVALKAISELNK